MKSRITIEVDFSNGNQPVIQIVGKNSITEPDVRDSLVQTFLEGFLDSNYAKIHFKLTDHDSGQLSFSSIATITPIKESSLCTEAKAILYRHEKVSPEKPQFFSRWAIGDTADYTTSKWRDEAFAAAKKKNPKTPDDDIEYLPHYSFGKIVAVKFTEAKVYYDILDTFTSKVVKEVVSDNVKNLSPEFSAKK